MGEEGRSLKDSGGGGLKVGQEFKESRGSFKKWGSFNPLTDASAYLRRAEGPSQNIHKNQPFIQ